MTKRLSKLHWINFGLDQLTVAGPTALRADPLCKALGVSRGSFYWHFDSLADFHAALLTAWEDRTRMIMAAVEQAAPNEQLAQLMQIAGSDTLPLERAMRAWAASSANVAAAVARIDQLRVDFVIAIFQNLGHDPEVAVARARFLYAASLGRIVSHLPDPNIAPDQLAQIAALLIRH